MSKPASPEVMKVLDEVFQEEMAGIIRYLHYSFMIMGPNRIPIQKWFRTKAQEGMGHAVVVGEKITSYGGHPILKAAEVPETHSHQVDKLLEECIAFETRALDLYKKLVSLSEKEEDIALEELARKLVQEETEHMDEVEKMLRKPK